METAQRLKIAVVIEDSNSVRGGLIRRLEENFLVYSFASPEDAMEFFNDAYNILILVTDFDFSGSPYDGLYVCEVLRLKFPATKILVITDEALENNPRLSRLAKFPQCEILQKPVSAYGLNVTIERLVGKREPGQV